MSEITPTPPRPLPADFPTDLCGDQLSFWVCREPVGHTGPHYTGDLGEATAFWIGESSAE